MTAMRRLYPFRKEVYANGKSNLHRASVQQRQSWGKGSRGKVVGPGGTLKNPASHGALSARKVR